MNRQMRGTLIAGVAGLTAIALLSGCSADNDCAACVVLAPGHSAPVIAAAARAAVPNTSPVAGPCRGAVRAAPYAIGSSAISTAPAERNPATAVDTGHRVSCSVAPNSPVAA